MAGGFRPPQVIQGEPKNVAPFNKPATSGKTPVPAASVTGVKYSTFKNQVKVGSGQQLGFTKGKGYYAKTLPAPPAPKGKTPGRPPAPKPPKPVALTPQQLAQQAVDQSLAPLYASQQQQSASRNAAIQQFTQALIQAVQGIPGQTGQAFDSAIAGQTQLAQNAMDALRNANPNQQDQQMLQFLGAPQQQQSNVANQLNNAFNGGGAVQYYTGGVLPAGLLQSQKLAAMTLQGQLPAIEALRGQQAFSQALQEEQTARSALDQQKADLLQKYLASYQDAASKQQEFNATQAYRKATLGLSAAKLNASTKLASQKQAWQQTYQSNLLTLKQQGLISSNQYKSLSLKLRQQQINSTNAYRQAQLAIKANGFKTVGNSKTGIYAVRPDGSKTLLIPPVPGGGGKVPTASNPFPNLTKAQQQHLRSGIATAFYGRKAQTDPNNKKKVTTTALPPVSYQQAITEAVKAGYSRAAATRMANRFYMPGQRGRPKGNAAQGAATGASYDLTKPQGAMQYASSQLGRYGWSPSEMAALTRLWNQESGWNFLAKNPSSGALGIPQELGHAVPVDYRTNPRTQIDWGLRYIKQRYGSPSNAWAHEVANNWY